MLADKDHHTYSPERYQKYKGELRKAVLEYYRTLELIKNYRVGLRSQFHLHPGKPIWASTHVGRS
jgi:hypothetical protein